jgi:F420-non-reducing hydrogenase large subunit
MNNMESLFDSKDSEIAFFNPGDYVDYIGEWVEPWTYIRLKHLKKIGWKGLVEGEGSSLYRVGPLARLNVAEGMATALAEKEWQPSTMQRLSVSPLKRRLRG